MRASDAKTADQGAVSQAIVPPAALRSGGKLAFFLTLLYLGLEYGRPQSLFTPLQAVRLPALIGMLLSVLIVLSGKALFAGGQTKVFLLILLQMVVLGPIAVNNYWALMIFKAMAINFVAYLAVVSFVDGYARYRTMIAAWIGIHLFLAVVGYVKGGRGIGGFLADENDFCMTLNMVIPIVYFMAFTNISRIRKILAMGSICLFLFIIVLTSSRGGLIGLLAAGSYIFLRSRRKLLQAAVIASLTLFVILTAPPSYFEEVRSIHEEGISEGTASERIYEWKIGWSMFLDNPILGVGQGNFPFVFGRYEEAAGYHEGFRGRSRAGRAAHSIYFTLLPELGLVGTLLFLAMLVMNIRDLRFLRRAVREGGSDLLAREGPTIRALSLALESSLVAYLVSGIFISILYYPNFWVLTGFIVSLRTIVASSLWPGGGRKAR